MSGSWASGWAVGDLVTAAEFKKGLGSIYNTTLSGTASSIDITGLPTTYAALMVQFYGREDAVVGNDDLRIRFNGSSGGSYDFQDLQANNATLTASGSTAQTSMLAGIIPGASASANFFGHARMFIPHYGGTVAYHPFESFSFAEVTDASTMFTRAIGGQWRGTAAINQLTLLPGAGNFVTGSRVTVWALGG